MCVAVVTSAETMDDGSGGGMVDDVGAVVEVVKVVTTIEATKTKHVIQNQVLQTERGRRGTTDEEEDGQTGRGTGRRTDIPPPASSSWRRCSSGVSPAAVQLGSPEA